MIFSKRITWYRIFSSAEQAEKAIPLNKAIAVEAGEKRVCLARSSRGFFALEDKCPHQGAPLSGGWCTQENEMVCPFHRFHFDLETGKYKGSKSNEGTVETFPVRVDDKGVFIGIRRPPWKLFS